MHPRNRHQGRYDFGALTQASPELSAFVHTSPLTHEPTVDFADPAAVAALNRALLARFYGVPDGRVPKGYLCAPVPGRADYVHYAADLLAVGGKIPKGPSIKVLDVGVGANCIYPVIGHHEYGWRFVGTDVDREALASARRIADSTPKLAAAVELRLQKRASWVLQDVLGADERFALSLCNPPFHASEREAEEASRRKRRNLGQQPDAARNFGGGPTELWYPGGEDAFVRRMIQESAHVPQSVTWFTSLISQNETLPGVLKAAKKAGAKTQVVEMAHGQKKSRFLAWTFTA